MVSGASSAAFQLAYVILSESLNAKLFGVTLAIITAVNSGVGGLDGYLGGLLSDHFGFRSIFVVIFLLGTVALVVVFFTIPKAGRASPSGSWTTIFDEDCPIV